MIILRESYFSRQGFVNGINPTGRTTMNHFTPMKNYESFRQKFVKSISNGPFSVFSGQDNQNLIEQDLGKIRKDDFKYSDRYKNSSLSNYNYFRSNPDILRGKRIDKKLGRLLSISTPGINFQRREGSYNYVPDGEANIKLGCIDGSRKK